jgi:hypothetical protein
MGPLGSPPSAVVTGGGTAYVVWKGTDGNLWQALGQASGPLSGPSNLVPNQQLNVGQQLIAANNRLNLVLQGDGNLVLYRTLFNLPLFASATNGKPVNRAVMQSDGNLVLYGPDGTA